MKNKVFQENKDKNKCQCQYNQRIQKLQIKLIKIGEEINKIHKSMQKQNKQNEINLLELQIPPPCFYKSINWNQSFINNQTIIRQFDHIHDLITEMKGRVDSITGIQTNLDIQVSIIDKIIERQNQIIHKYQQNQELIKEINDTCQHIDKRENLIQVKLQWLVEYLTKCGYKYIDKVNKIG